MSVTRVGSPVDRRALGHLDAPTARLMRICQIASVGQVGHVGHVGQVGHWADAPTYLGRRTRKNPGWSGPGFKV